jgi:hypothetical protein
MGSIKISLIPTCIPLPQYGASTLGKEGCSSIPTYEEAVLFGVASEEL